MRPAPGDELLEQVGDLRLVAGGVGPDLTGELDEARIGDVLREVARAFDGPEPVFDVVDDQRRCGDRGQHRPDVDAAGGIDQAGDRGRSRRQSFESRELLAHRVVLDAEGRGEHAGSPVLLDRLTPAFGSFIGDPPRPVVAPGDARTGRGQEERPHAFRVRCGEHHRDLPAVGDTDDRRALRAGCVHDGEHVVHLLVDGREDTGRQSVGLPGPAFVEPDGSRVAVHLADREQLHRKARRLGLDRVDQPRHENDVAGTVAGDLVRDVQVAVARVPDVVHCNLPTASAA